MHVSSAELSRLNRLLIHEKRLMSKAFTRIAGVDEAGRGPLAGPVVAAACIFPSDAIFPHLNDSKQLNSEEREILYLQMSSYEGLSWGIGISDVETIDRINILQATLLAMQHAVAALPVVPDYILVDGNRLPKFDKPAEAIIEGDAKSLSIAAASIFAKVTRDRLMQIFDMKWPHYGFKNHKGYGTPKHLQALQKFGPCPIHRKSFAPIKGLVSSMQQTFFAEVPQQESAQTL